MSTARDRSHLRVVPRASTVDDRPALGRVAAGELAAMGEVYDRHAAAVLGFARRAAGANDAEDLLQTTFLRAARVAATFDGRSGDARRWLLGITARLVLERRRGLLRQARAFLGLERAAPPAIASMESDRLDLVAGLAQLTNEKRVVVVLAEVEGWTCEEIASMLGIPVGTVWTRLHHARKELRAWLAKEAEP